MAAIALGVIGGGAGFAAFGTLSAITTGFQLGMAIGKFAFERKPKLPPNVQGEMADSAITTSSFGQMVPWVMGKAPVAGNIPWSIPWRKVVTSTFQRSSGKGGLMGGGGEVQETQNISYLGTFMVALCDTLHTGPIIGVGRIKTNGELIHDVLSTSPVKSILGSTIGLRVYTGDITQEPDSIMEAHVGIGRTPAYRHTAYIIFPDFPREKFGRLEIEVIADGSSSWVPPYDLYTLPGGDAFSNVGTVSGVGATLTTRRIARSTAGGHYLWAVTGSDQKTLTLYDNFTEAEVFSHPSEVEKITIAGVGYNGRCWIQEHGVGTNPGRLLAISITNQIEIDLGDVHGANDNDNRWHVVYEFDAGDGDQQFGPIVLLQYNPPAAGRSELMKLFGGVKTELNGPIDNSKDHYEFAENADAIAGRCYFWAAWSQTPPLSSTPGMWGWLDPVTLEFAILKTWDRDSFSHVYVGNDGFVYARSMDTGTANVVKKYTRDGAEVDSVTLPGLSSTAYGNEPDRMGMDAYGNLYWQVSQQVWLINYGTMEIVKQCTFPDGNDRILGGDAWNGKALLVIRSLLSGSNTVVREIDPFDRLAATGALLGTDIIKPICAGCGYVDADTDVTDVDDIVEDGYVVAERTTGRGAIEPLLPLRGVNAVESDNKLKWRKLDHDPVASIPANHLAAYVGGQPPDELSKNRSNQQELPAELNLHYMSRDKDYLFTPQAAQRPGTSGGLKLDVRVPVVMTDSAAKQTVEAMMDRSHIEGAEKYEWTTPRYYARYDPIDVFTIIEQGTAHNVRAIKQTENAGGLINWEGVPMLPAAFIQTSPGVVPGNTVATIPVDGPTIALPFDAPLLRNEDNSEGMYGGAKGTSSAWPGSEWWQSLDGGGSYSALANGRFFEASTIGSTVTALADWPDDETNELVDEGSVVRVSVPSGHVLTDVTDEQLLAGVNAAMIGDEVVFFRTATFVSAATYDLSGLLRGRLGSEQFMSGHTVGERFVLLDAKVHSIPQSSSARNRQSLIKPVTFGQTLAATGAQPFAYTGRRLKPLAPVNLVVVKLENGDLYMRWDRRTRFQFDLLGGQEPPLGENVERYRVNFYDDEDELINSYESTTQEFTYTVAQQTADTGFQVYVVGVGVSQMSDIVGAGYEKRVDFSYGHGAHFYWRFFSMDAAGADGMMYTEIKLLEGVTDVSVNGTSIALASAGKMVCTQNMGMGGAGNDVQLWFNRDFTLNIGTNVNTATVENAASFVRFDFALHFGRPVALTAINFAGTPGELTRYLAGLTVQWSDDDTNWTTAKVISGLAAPNSGAYYASDISLL